jgi:hypothetical protein
MAVDHRSKQITVAYARSSFHVFQALRDHLRDDFSHGRGRVLPLFIVLVRRLVVVLRGRILGEGAPGKLREHELEALGDLVRTLLKVFHALQTLRSDTIRYEDTV